MEQGCGNSAELLGWGPLMNANELLAAGSLGGVLCKGFVLLTVTVHVPGVNGEGHGGGGRAAQVPARTEMLTASSLCCLPAPET